MQNKICLKFKCKLFIICTRRGTRQDPPKKVTTLHCAAARGSVRCAVDITIPNITKENTLILGRNREITAYFTEIYFSSQPFSKCIFRDNRGNTVHCPHCLRCLTLLIHCLHTAYIACTTCLHCIGETGTRSNTFFSFCYFSHNKYFFQNSCLI